MQISRMKKQFILNGLVLLATIFSLHVLAKEKISSCSDLLKRLKTASHSFYSEEAIKSSTLVATLNDIYNRRTVAQQRKINANLTALHAQNEMTFQTKNPRTGFYDKFTAVPVNGIVAPIAESQFNNLVQSTAPLMRYLRSFLQRVYSQDELTPENLAISGLQPTDSARVIQIIKDSIYLEPALKSGSMKDYPFLSVGGFDGAIGDPSHPEPIFYEMNLGTPSGLSNNTYLTSYLESTDREVYQTLSSSFRTNSTFSNLRNAVESNALSWTNNPQGISVVISPGVYNGAHPDVAAIAKYASMPLVHASDLFEDIDGNIRLNLGPKFASPIVTGIYGRTEESYFFQSNENNIPMISPFYVDVNKKLNAQLGLSLRPGAIYSYIKDDSGNITDVERDEKNQPILQQVWDTIGQDPARPDAPRGSFAKAVVNRKLYFSGLGGRVVDDKRLFRLFSELFKSRDVARPVQGLDPNHLEEFFANPDAYVVKEPANSGGQGVEFMGLVDSNKRNDLLARVKANPGDFEIQNIREVTTLPSVGNHEKTDVATDIRLFITMDAHGVVSAGSQSLLLRTAQAGNLLSNTSKGGGYGIAVVYKDQEYKDQQQSPPAHNFFTGNRESPLPNMGTNLTLTTEKHSQDMIATIDESVSLALATQTLDAIDELQFKELQTRAENLSYQIRAVMDLLPGDAAVLAGACRDFAAAKKITPAVITRFHEKLLIYLSVVSKSLSNVQNFVKDEIELALQKSRSDIETLGIQYAVHSGDPENVPGMRTSRSRPSDSSVAVADNGKAIMRTFRAPEIIYRLGPDLVKAEIAEYLRVQDAASQALIDRVHAVGGEVRMAKELSRHNESSAWWQSFTPAYFWVNVSYTDLSSYLKPVIAMNLRGGRFSMPSFEHEFAHLKFWKAIYDKHRALGQTHEEASKLAVKEVDEPQNWVDSERAAVTAEMKAEDELEKQNGGVHYIGLNFARHFYELAYVNRVTYPEFEGIRKQLLAEKGNFKNDMNLVKKWLRDMIVFAENNRAQAIAYLSDSEKHKGVMAEAVASMLLHRWKVADVESLILYPHGQERLNPDGLADRFKQLLKEAEEEYRTETKQTAPP